MEPEGANKEEITEEEVKEEELELAEKALSSRAVQAEWLNAHLETLVETGFADGTFVRGTLTQFDGETLVLQQEVEPHKSTLVFKNTVSYVEEAAPYSQGVTRRGGRDV